MIHYIENDYLRVGVKEFGAELTSIVSKETGYEFMWQGNPDIWSGQSPILFPIIGRLIDDKYTLDGKEYTMDQVRVQKTCNLVKLRGIDTMDAAQAMRGKVIELYREDIDDEVIFADELLGVEVFAAGEKLGKIVDVLDYPSHAVYVVKGKHEYMIPAVKQFILETDMEANRMQVKLIEGMRSDEN